jgi:hypothetical protein
LQSYPLVMLLIKYVNLECEPSALGSAARDLF